MNASAIAAAWQDTLQRSPLPPRAGGVTDAEYELARRLQAGPILIIDTPAAETWIWSDLHFRDAGRLAASGRPFASLGEMEEAILDAWHTHVGPTDTVICLGDVAYPSAFDDEAFVDRLRDCPGDRVLVVGNHDLAVQDQLASAGFDEQCAAALCATEPAAALTHVPLARIPYGCVHLHGHTHGRGDPAPRLLDVGIDAIGFAPRRLDHLLDEVAHCP